MDKQAIYLETRMKAAVTQLQRAADDLANYLEEHPDLVGLSDDTAVGDNSRAALAGARAWRSLLGGAADV